MADHPTLRQLEDLLLGQLPGPEEEAVFSHLETGCEICHRSLTHLVSTLAAPPLPEKAVDLAALDCAISSAFATVLERAHSLERARSQVRRKMSALRAARNTEELERSGVFRLDGWACCEALLECCREERHRNPQRMVFFARCAQIRSRFLDPEQYGRWAVADFKALTWAELGNAYRVADELAKGEKAMTAAFRVLEQGSGDRLLLARILALAANLDLDSRRTAEAGRKLDRAYAIFMKHHERQRAGRVLVQKSICLMHEQRTEKALKVLSASLRLIDPAEDPRLALAASHNLVRLLTDKGEYRRAQRQLFRQRPLYFQDGDPVNLIKLRWLEAQIDAGLGKLERATIGLQEVRAGFRELKKEYHVALVGLELAAVWVRQGKPELVSPLADEIIAVFRSLGIAREAIATVLVLRQAYEQGKLTLQIVQHVAQFLQDLERDPSARFEP